MSAFPRAALAAGALLTMLLLAPAAPAAVGGFNATDGALDAGVTTVLDRAGPDDVFKDGSKENEPGSWVYELGSTNGKTDFVKVHHAVTETDTASFLYVAFDRTSAAGSVFLSYELNQVRRRWTNSAGVAVPCRSNGDILVDYQTGAVSILKWVGTPGSGSAECPDGGTGSWQPAGAGVIAEGSVPSTFGEAAVDLGSAAKAAGLSASCEYFRTLQVHSRVSNSTSANLGDYVADQAISVAACKPPDGPGGGDTTPPEAPTLAASAGCHPDGTVALSGTAEPASQVQVRSGTATVALATADAEGDWSATVTDLADGQHTLRARARDAASNVSADSSPVTVTVDSQAPAAPVVIAPGEVNAGGDVLLTGTAQPGATVEVREGETALGTAVAAADGAWSFTVTAVQAGDHSYAVRATDACATGAATTVAVTAKWLGGTQPVTPGGGTATNPGAKPAAGGVAGRSKGGGCTVKPFTVFINAKGIKRVTYTIDRRTVAVLTRKDRKGRFSLRVDPRRFAAKVHRIKARIVPRRGKARTVPMRSFTACEVGRCVSRRAFKIRVRKVRGDRVRSAVVYVNRKRVKVVRGKRLRAAVVLTGLPRGRFTVKVVAKLASGLTDVDERTYRTCAGKAKPKR